MKTRILVGVVGLPLLLLVLLVLPPIATGILVAGMYVIAVYELLVGTGLVKDLRLVGASALMALFIGLCPAAIESGKYFFWHCCCTLWPCLH